jgi:hypothetical protein
MVNDKVIHRNAAEKRIPPSRIKYEQSHPTVSCRIPKVIYERLKESCKNDKKSMADILKIGLGSVEERTGKGEAEYAKGYKAGYQEAERTFKITYRCSVCGEEIAITSDEEKKEAAEYMEKERWGHSACIENQK